MKPKNILLTIQLLSRAFLEDHFTSAQASTAVTSVDPPHLVQFSKERAALLRQTKVEKAATEAIVAAGSKPTLSYTTALPHCHAVISTSPSRSCFPIRPFAPSLIRGRGVRMSNSGEQHSHQAIKRVRRLADATIFLIPPCSRPGALMEASQGVNINTRTAARAKKEETTLSN